jgi:hypothetical protein
MTETWLRDHLIRTGRMTERGITRRARIRTCRRCNADVLAGLDNFTGALEVAADPVPLSPLGEAVALAKGHRTFALHQEAGSWVLDRRDDEHIAHHPAGTRTHEDVVPSHVCGTAWTGPLTAPTRFPETRPPAPTGSTPPF